MPSENFNIDEITEARRKSIAETIHPISVEELNVLGEGLFPGADHPWRERFFNFLAENSEATFYHGTTHDRVHIIYCRSKENGIWFMGDLGMGPLQTKGLKILKEIVDAGR